MNELKINNSFRNIPIIRGVIPVPSFASIFAFLFNSSLTTTMLPTLAAIKRKLKLNGNKNPFRRHQYHKLIFHLFYPF